jgi:hypothetical protein
MRMTSTGEAERSRSGSLVAKLARVEWTKQATLWIQLAFKPESTKPRTS